MMIDIVRTQAESSISNIDALIGTDAGGRGMKHLIVPGDLQKASSIFANLKPPSHVLVLSGFPCCVTQVPPTETDGPPGAIALARAAFHLGHDVTVVTDECNRDVFAAAMKDLEWATEKLSLACFPSKLTSNDEERLEELAKSCGLILACERAGPAGDGNCYTMRGIDMTGLGLIAPIHTLMEKAPSVPFLAIGDGGNELGMGKVLAQVEAHIPKGEKIGCAVAADHLVAASVSNWGGYALAAGAAVMRAAQECRSEGEFATKRSEWITACLPTEADEVALLNRCVDVGCRDGVSGQVEATVDGMPLETSMEALRSIHQAALGE